MRLKLKTNKMPLGLKWGLLFWMALLLNWLRVEDVDLIYVTILGILASGFVTLNFAANRSIKNQLRAYLFTGVIAGILVSLITFFLIVFKSSLHAHGFFEIPGVQLMDVLLNTAWWLGLGLFGGVFSYYLRNKQQGIV